MDSGRAVGEAIMQHKTSDLFKIFASWKKKFI